MCAYARVLLIVLAVTTVPVAEAACIAEHGTAEARAGTPRLADRCNAPEPPDGRVTAQQLDAIMQWIAERFELPKSIERPAIVLEDPAALTRMRNGGFVTGPASQNATGVEYRSDRGEVLAVYDDARRTIHLSDHWTGETEAELSVLVHEMVHHLQNIAGMKYNCAGDREKLAYQAQSAWLRQFGKSLESEFGLDGFSVIVHSNCL